MANSKFLHEEHYRGKHLVADLAKHKIAICGAGALGSNLAESLARQGYTNIKVADFDRVELHNIQSQVYTESDVGATKTKALQARIFISTHCEIEILDKKLDENNIKKFLKDATLTVDAFDNSASRQLIQTYCREKKIPCLHAGLMEDYGEVIWDENYQVPRDAEGDVCEYPMARNLVMIVVHIAAEEINNFCLQKMPRKSDWSFTLKDLTVKPFDR